MLAVSCTYEYNADIPSDTRIIIIDGRIVAGGNTVISLSRAMTLNGTPVTSGFNASGIIECEDGSSIKGSVSTDESSQYSLVFDTHGIDQSKKYRVLIDAGQDGAFQSDWLSIYEAPTIDKFSYEVVTDNGVRSLDFRVSAHSDVSPYFAVSYLEAWEHTALTTTRLEYFPETNQVAKASWSGHEHPYYRCWQKTDKEVIVISAAAHSEKKIEDAYLTKISQNDLKISVLYRIIVNVTSTGKDYYEYWDNLRSISAIDGDLFTPIPSIMEGNVHRQSGDNLVIGFLGAGAAATDTLYYRNQGFYRRPKYLNDRLNELLYYKDIEDAQSDQDKYYCPLKAAWPSAYAEGNVPVMEILGPEGIIPDVYAWGKKQCVDCRYLGGDYTFPEDWPDRNDPNL